MRRAARAGSVHGVPLGDGRLARAVVSRVSSTSRGVLFGYFLAPADGDQDDGLHPEHAVCISRFGDLGILRGRWPLLGQVEDVGAYPVPQFVARPSLGGEFVVAYRDDDVGVVLSRTPVRAGTDGLPEDGLAGFGYVEQRLARLLSERR